MNDKSAREPAIIGNSRSLDRDPVADPRPDAADQRTSFDGLTDILIRYRWLFVVPVLLPLSTLFDLIWAVRGFYFRRVRHAPERHDKRVNDIQAQVRRRQASGAPGRLCTSRKNWMSVSARMVDYKQPETAIRIDLHDILYLDAQRRIVRVEPRVTIGQLIDHLVPRGWTLPVMPELDDLTVSGLFLGYGVEVSSHKHGLFSELVRSCDVVLGGGQLVRASAEENTDLFNALPWSQGALGFVVALELQIIPARPYVQVTYRPVSGLEELCRTFEQEVRREDAADFIEGILFDRDEGLIITGAYADQAEAGKIHAANRWYMPWFALRSRQFIGAGGHEEYIPVTHFYRRHNRGMYWESELIVPFGNHPLFRFLMGWAMPPKISFLRLTQGERIRRYYDEKHVLQDALVPIRHLAKTVSYFDDIFDAYPVWLCPVRLNRKEPSGSVGPGADAGDHEMYVDVAVLAVPGPVLRGEEYNALDSTRLMERFLIENRGYQALYAVTQLSHDEFRRMFDCRLYDRARWNYGAEGVLMDVYEKVRMPSQPTAEQ